MVEIIRDYNNNIVTIVANVSVDLNADDYVARMNRLIDALHSMRKKVNDDITNELVDVMEAIEEYEEREK